MVSGLLVTAAMAIMFVVGYDSGAADNRVTPQDMSAYTACLAYYRDAQHCYVDVISSWQH